MVKFKIALLAGFAAATLASSFARADDIEEGRKNFNKYCVACHINTATGAKRLGPTMFGVVGRKAGTVPEYQYSEANLKSGLTWTPEELDKYLNDPKGVVPGTKMSFAGVKKKEEREDLIKYLASLK